jgi:hypothetical protein
MDDLLREHQHMLDTVTRECLLTDLTLASVVDEFLRDTHAFCARTALTCAADTMAHVSVDDGHTVYARCVQQLNTMMTAMMKLPTSTSAGYRTMPSPPQTVARKPPVASVHTFKAPTAAHASAHEQLISRCELCMRVLQVFTACSIAKELIESLVAHSNRTV